MTIYLYIKTHNVTGLKYFGKTKRDPFVYKGSGVGWKQHLREHGDDITTEIHAQFDEETQKDLLMETALAFSRVNDIVDSPLWANLIVEEGVNATPEYMSTLFALPHRERKGPPKPAMTAPKLSALDKRAASLAAFKEFKKLPYAERMEYYKRIL